MLQGGAFFAWLWVSPAAKMPGKDQWAAKSLRSGFGQQCISSKVSSPGFGFGSSSRDAFAKVGAPVQLSHGLFQLHILCGLALRHLAPFTHPTKLSSPCNH